MLYLHDPCQLRKSLIRKESSVLDELSAVSARAVRRTLPDRICIKPGSDSEFWLFLAANLKQAISGLCTQRAIAVAGLPDLVQGLIR